MLRLFLILSLCLVLPPAVAQDAEEMHRFTDKKGQQILAMLLDVSEDRRTMRIRREDGQEFESVINVLSLDDQQYIKDWMKNRPEKTDFRLEVDIAKRALETERHERSSGSYTLEQRFQAFAITVRNLSRETLPSARIEYVVVWSDLVGVYQDDFGGWDYRYYDDEDMEGQRVQVSGQEELGALAFNRDAEVVSKSYESNRVSFSGEVYQEDEPIGIIVRIVNSSGVVLAEVRSGGAGIDQLSWEDAVALPEPSGR